MDTINTMVSLDIRDQCYNCQKVLILRDYLGQFGTVKKIADSQQRVPLLHVGAQSFDFVNTILRMFATCQRIGDLYGHNDFERGLIDQWLDWSVGELETPACALTYPLLGLATENKAVQKQARADVMSRLKILDDHLLNRTYMLGDFVSIADIALICASHPLFTHALGPNERNNFGNVTRWFTQCVHLEHFASVLGEVVFLAKPENTKKAAVPKLKKEATPAPASTTASTIVPAAPGSVPSLYDPIDQEVSSLKYSFPLRYTRRRVYLNKLLLSADKGAQFIGQEVTVCGWSRTTRDQGGFAFVSINDGSCFESLQVVVDNKIPGFQDLLKSGSVSVSLEIKGTIVKSPAKGQTIEMKALSVRVLGSTDSAEYPLAKKKHSLEHLRDYAHLRSRTNTIGAVVRIRNACAYATHLFFNQRGFKYIHTPIITTADCEGAGEMFSVTTLFPMDPKKPMPLSKEGCPDYSQDFFKEHAKLTVSGQLNVEPFCCSMGDVYTFGPTFRAENSHTVRHLSEFWMIEPEMAFADIYDDMDVAEDYVKFCTAYVLEHCSSDIDFFEAQVEKGLRARLINCLDSPFARITYTETIEILNQPENLKKGHFDMKPVWGIDLGSEHERYITEEVFKKPVIVTGYPKEIKAFYMKLNPDGKTVAAMDILVPKIGELIGGSQREEHLDILMQKMKDMNMNTEELDWYLDLRRYGTVVHSGFGLGFERLIMYVTGLENIRDVIPYPRWPKNAKY